MIEVFGDKWDKLSNRVASILEEKEMEYTAYPLENMTDLQRFLGRLPKKEAILLVDAELPLPVIFFKNDDGSNKSLLIQPSDEDLLREIERERKEDE